jgi:CRISPR-associated endonuclease/helicase Cas3
MDQTGQGQSSLTQAFATAKGKLSYQELADAIAPHLLALLSDVAAGRFDDSAFDEDLILSLHRRIVGGLMPDIAGRWRSEGVQVGHHVPPEPYLVPLRMRDYCANVRERCRHADSLDLQIELLAYAEGEFLTIHPFLDFNGRTVRVILAELLRRLELPFVEVAVARRTPEFKAYQDALADYDNSRIQPLAALWEQRLSQAAI